MVTTNSFTNSCCNIRSKDGSPVNSSRNMLNHRLLCFCTRVTTPNTAHPLLLGTSLLAVVQLWLGSSSWICSRGSWTPLSFGGYCTFETEAKSHQPSIYLTGNSRHWQLVFKSWRCFPKLRQRQFGFKWPTHPCLFLRNSEHRLSAELGSLLDNKLFSIKLSIFCALVFFFFLSGS